MNPELFAAFSNGNPLSSNTQSLIQPAITQSEALQERLTVTDSGLDGAILTPMQLADTIQRIRCLTFLVDFIEVLDVLDAYITASLETVIDDLCLQRNAQELDKILGIETGSVTSIVGGGMDHAVQGVIDQMSLLDEAITDYEADDLDLDAFNAQLELTADTLETAVQNIHTSIENEDAEKARIVQQHKAMSRTLRVQILMENDDTRAILQNLGLVSFS